ncbi:hypothetical protein U9M48_007826 [Paspalum notatum var. saurae]|uniref:glutathione transferase n=1 Tax=Paspalum notatum var. saurae TaxID=547442 RepID=A0AAQ3SMW9_PASNO
MAGEKGEQLKLVGQWGSAFVTRVKLALELKGLNYESVEEDLRNKSELLLRSNPVHNAVPVLIHSGNPICESQIILQYIDEAFAGVGGTPLLPADPYQRSVARFWAAYIEDKLVVPWDRVFRARTDEERNEALRQMSAAVEALEGGLEDCSKGKRFFGGDSVGYVDVVLGGAASYAKAHEPLFGAKLFDAARTPRLAAWLERFCELDAARAVLQDVNRVVQYGRMLIAKNSARPSNN